MCWGAGFLQFPALRFYLRNENCLAAVCSQKQIGTLKDVTLTGDGMRIVHFGGRQFQIQLVLDESVKP
jgi:hypothetical protein